MKKKSVLCKLGLHKWAKAVYQDLGSSSNVKDYRKKCQRCGKRKTWVEAK